MTTPPPASTRNRPSVALTLVYASTAVTWAAYALMAVALPFRFQSLHLSVAQYGIAIAALALGMLLTEAAWGVVAFRLGNARTILLLGVVVGVLYAAVGVSDSFLTLVVSLGLLGALFVFQVPLMRWMALTAWGPGTGGQGSGVYGLFSGTGLVVGTALGPLLFVEFGFARLTILVIVAYLVGVSFTILLPWDQVSLPPRRRGFARHIRAVFSRPFALGSALVVLAYFGKSLVWSFLQYYSVGLFHGTPSQAGYVIGAAQATSLVAGAVLGVLVDRWGAGQSTPFGFFLVLLGAFGTLFSTSYPEMVGATLVFATGLGWLSASLLPLALGGMPASQQGTAVGVFGSFEDLGLLVGPVVIGFAYAGYGVHTVFVLVAAVALAGVLLSLTIRGGRLGDSPRSATESAPPPR
ncbi:MAG: MFS transporter [Thermoplasmata archaeon]|nr:MFS transporter [Thermoplasmata archaeon]